MIDKKQKLLLKVQIESYNLIITIAIKNVKAPKVEIFPVL